MTQLNYVIIYVLFLIASVTKFHEERYGKWT